MGSFGIYPPIPIHSSSPLKTWWATLVDREGLGSVMTPNWPTVLYFHKIIT